MLEFASGYSCVALWHSFVASRHSCVALQHSCVALRHSCVASHARVSVCMGCVKGRRGVEKAPSYHKAPQPAVMVVSVASGHAGTHSLTVLLLLMRALCSKASKTPGRTAGQYLYRYDYWFQSNQSCTTQSNYHVPSLGSMHQDEVSFVFGQPIFMFVGYTNCTNPKSEFYDPGTSSTKPSSCLIMLVVKFRNSFERPWRLIASWDTVRPEI